MVLTFQLKIKYSATGNRPNSVKYLLKILGLLKNVQVFNGINSNAILLIYIFIL